MKSPNHKINKLKIKHDILTTEAIKNAKFVDLSPFIYTYENKLEQTRRRIKLQNRIDRCLKMDVAHGTIETIYAVFNRVMWLIISNVKRIINKIIGGFKMNRFMLKIKKINIILVDIGYNKSNNNYWLDFRLFGLGFDYDSISNITFKNDYKKYINLNDKGGK